MFASVLVLVIAELIACAMAEEKYFLEFTDMHVEKNYLPGSDTSKRCVTGEGDAPDIAFVGCDMSDKSVRMYLNKVKEMYPNPEFIMYNGDSNPHYIDFGYASTYTRDDVVEYTEYGLQLIRDAFPDTLILPILGNHDNYPSDQFADNDEFRAHLNVVGQIFSAYIPQSEVNTLVSKGYYVHDIDDSMRVIVLTTVMCDPVNFYATFTGGENDMGMFDALKEQLDIARNEGKHVLLAFHRPAGHVAAKEMPAVFLPVCRDKLRTICNNYKDILTYGSFTGHTHKNSFRLFVDDDGVPTHAQFVVIGLTSYSSQQPGSAVFYWDEDKHIITDWIQLYMDVNESNATGDAVVKKFNSFAQDFNIPDCSAASMYEVFKNNCKERDSEQMQNYYRRVYGNTPDSPRLNNKNWALAACASGPVEPELYDECFESLKSGNPYEP